MRRPVGIAAIVLFLMSAAARAQGPAPSPQYPYGFDPYKPSDAAWLRMYGSALVAQTPIADLRRLDPYKPSDAALLRSMGGGIPLWWAWGAQAPYYGPVSPISPTAGGSWQGGGGAPYIVVLNNQPAAGVSTSAPTAPAAAPQPTAVATVRRPESNDGIWIAYDGRRWISRGVAVPFNSSVFTPVGQYRGYQVFRRTGTSEDVIYLPTEGNLIAPFRPAAR